MHNKADIPHQLVSGGVVLMLTQHHLTLGDLGACWQV